MNGLFVLFASAGSFLNFTKLEQLFVGYLLGKLLEAGRSLYVLTLFTSVVALTTHPWDNT